MYDYTNFSDNVFEDFILSYRVENDKLVITYSCTENNKRVVKEIRKPNNTENKRIVLSKMRKQVLENKDLIKRSRFESIVSIISLLIMGTSAGVCFGFDYTQLAGILTTISFISLPTISNTVNNHLSLKEDLKKNILFINNEEKINKNIENEEILTKLKENTQDIIRKEHNLNLNNIGSIKESELTRILTLSKK